MSTCGTPCLIVDTPGPRGLQGPAGTDGTDGINAFTLTTAAFVMPAEGGNVTVDVADSSWVAVQQIVFVGTPTGGARGTFRVYSKPSGTSLVLTNLKDSVLEEYLDNSVPGTNFASSSLVAPSGLQGPPGVNGTSGAPTNATFITQTPDAGLTNEQALSALATGIMKVTSVTGVVSSVTADTQAGGQAPNDGALVAGRAVFGTAAGIETKTASDARTALGLGTMATQDANNVNITGGTITGVTLPGPTSLFEKDYLLYQDQRTTGTNAGAFNQGSWVTVPLNTEVADTGNYGTIAGNTVTLQPGTYRARWRVCGLQVDDFQSRLYNVSTTSVVGYGSNAVAAAVDSSTSWSEGEMRFTVGSATQLRLEAQCKATNGTTGFGQANNFGASEVYASLEFKREAS